MIDLVRRFWWQASLLAALLVTGCGGSSGSGQDTLPDMPFTEQQAGIAFAGAELTAAGLTVENFETKVEDYVKALRESGRYKEVGFDVTEDRLVWVRFADGTLMVIPFNRETSTQPSVARSEFFGRTAQGYPRSTQSALLNTFRSSDYSSGISAIRPLLTAAGYTQATGTSSMPLEGTLEDFLRLQDAGIIYVDGHGATLPPVEDDGTFENWLYLATKSEYTESIKKLYNTEFKKQRLIVGYEPSGGQSMVFMSDVFVKSNVKVASKSLVFLNTCWNGSRDRMAKAFFANGAGTVIGWDRKVQDSDAYETSLYFFDRLLGLQSLAPNAHDPSKPSWPSLFSEVLHDLSTTKRPGKSYTYDTDVKGSKIKVYTALDSARQILPSIRVVETDQVKNLIRIRGEFGPDSGNVVGLPGSVELSIRSWSSSQIEVANVAGISQVQVKSGPLLSNFGTVPNGEFTFGEDSIPSGLGQVLFSHVDIPKSSLARGTLSVTLLVNSKEKFQYTVPFPVATTPVSLASTFSKNPLAPSGNIVTSLDGGTYNFPSLLQGYPLVYDNGDKLIVVLYRKFYGGNSGLNFADAQASLRNFTSTQKLRLTKSFFEPVNSLVTFGAP